MAFCILKDSENYMAEVAEGLPWGMRQPLADEYFQIRKRAGYREANLFLTELKEVAAGVKFALAQDDDALVKKADQCADNVKRFITLTGGSEEDALLYALDYSVNVMKITPPDAEKHGNYGALMRLACPKWWRRALRKQHARGLEKLEIQTGRVSKRAGIYSSNDTVARRREQKTRNTRILDSVKAVNNEGQEYTLTELSALNVSNPAIRRMELMTRIAGFEEVANEWGMVGEFYTLTAPSKFHARLSKSGGENPKYKGYTPTETQAFLSNQWAKIRAAWNRAGVEPFGFRVVEPHHDGTPHWHLLLFMPPQHVLFARAIMSRYALEVDGTEAGAVKQRFKAVAIDKKRGSAAGYIAKYIAKAIDGFGVDYDLFGVDAAKASERIEAWASTWGIRQFQQIGGPSVTVWRELRRLEGEQDSKLLEAARVAADEGNWAEYCRLNWGGGVSLLREVVEGFGQYGDEKAEPVLGVYDNFAGVGVVTRIYTWEIGRGLADTEKERSGEAAPPWSTVNNCTAYDDTKAELQRLEEVKRLQNQAYREYQKQKAAGEDYDGGFMEFYEQFIYERGCQND